MHIFFSSSSLQCLVSGLSMSHADCPKFRAGVWKISAAHRPKSKADSRFQPLASILHASPCHPPPSARTSDLKTSRIHSFVAHFSMHCLMPHRAAHMLELSPLFLTLPVSEKTRGKQTKKPYRISSTVLYNRRAKNQTSVCVALTLMFSW